VYHSILSLREHYIDVADFEEAPNLIYNYCSPQEQDEKNLGLWERNVPLTPKQIYDRITDGYGENTRAGVNLNKKGEFSYFIRPDSGAIEKFEIEATFRIGKRREIQESRIIVSDESQGKGIGKLWLRNMVELSAALGFDHFAFVAGLDNGGYTWAKAGAYIDDDVMRIPDPSVRTQTLSENMSARLEVAKPFLTAPQYEQAHALCSLGNTDDLVILTRMGDITLPREALQGAREKMEHVFHQLGDEDALRHVDTQERRLTDTFDAAARQNKAVCLPKFLLSGMLWNAVVDFTNHRQMETVGRYVGGWRTIAPEQSSAGRLSVSL